MWVRQFEVDEMTDAVHFGDCIKMPVSCSVCELECDYRHLQKVIKIWDESHPDRVGDYRSLIATLIETVPPMPERDESVQIQNRAYWDALGDRFKLYKDYVTRFKATPSAESFTIADDMLRWAKDGETEPWS